MTRKWSLLLAPIAITLLAGCGGNNKTSIAFSFEADERTGFAVNEIKEAAEKANFNIAESKGDITISFAIDANLGEQSYRIAKEDKAINVTGGDQIGLMYGGLDVAETLKIHGNFDKLEAKEHHPHVQYRGVSVRPPMDLRTPSYTNNGDSTRWNLENTWDLNYWKGLFDIMARMRYNILSFATVNSIASMKFILKLLPALPLLLIKINGVDVLTVATNCKGYEPTLRNPSKKLFSKAPIFPNGSNPT